MASRKKNYRHRSAPGRFEENFNSVSYSNGHRSGSSSERENQFYCDICGYTLLQAGNIPPMCTRCMIPMNLLRPSNVNRSKNDKKQSFDYSSRIFYQTDGHPQYKGLPLDHPDPDDLHAVEAYRNRKESGRRRAPKPHGGDFRQGDRSDAQRQRPVHHHQPQPQRQPNEPRKIEKTVETERAPQEESARPDQSPQRQPDHRRDRRRRTPQRRNLFTPPAAVEPAPGLADPTPPVARDDDYAGTTLTSNRSAATILSENSQHPVDDNPETLRSDYLFKRTDDEHFEGTAVLPPAETGDKEKSETQ